MRRLLHWLGLVDLVWMTFYDGDKHLRIVWYDEHLNRYVFWTNTHSPHTLLPNGATACANGTLMYKAWQDYDLHVPQRLRWRRPTRVERVKHRLLS